MPYNILENIFGYLTAADLTIVSQICVHVNTYMVYFQERKNNLLFKLVRKEYSKAVGRNEFLEFSDGASSRFDRTLYGHILRKYVKDYPYSTTVKINVVLLSTAEIQRIIRQFKQTVCYQFVVTNNLSACREFIVVNYHFLEKLYCKPNVNFLLVSKFLTLIQVSECYWMHSLANLSESDYEKRRLIQLGHMYDSDIRQEDRIPLRRANSSLGIEAISAYVLLN